MALPYLDSFYVICDPDHRSSIREVRVCFTLDEPGAETYTKCSDRYLQQMQNPCIYPIYLKEKSVNHPEPEIISSEPVKTDKEEEL